MAGAYVVLGYPAGGVVRATHIQRSKLVDPGHDDIVGLLEFLRNDLHVLRVRYGFVSALSVRVQNPAIVFLCENGSHFTLSYLPSKTTCCDGVRESYRLPRTNFLLVPPHPAFSNTELGTVGSFSLRFVGFFKATMPLFSTEKYAVGVRG
jgi:hypothetical protein